MSAAPVRHTPRATVVRADNPGVMTLDGTNTWVLREPGAQGVVVVDPGPLDESHLTAILEIAGSGSGRVKLVLYTHWHPDHTEAIDRFAELTGAPARAIASEWCRDAPPVVDAETLEIDGLALRVMATPGHTMDSMCIVLPAEGSLLSGDTVLGSGTTVIAHPDGKLAPYLTSLEKIRSAINLGKIERILPAHGPVIEEPADVIDYYLTHREDRLQQVRDCLAQGAQTAREVVERVYASVDCSLWEAAEMSVRAQLEYLGDSEAPTRG